jgi:hypothetical protein
MWLHFKHTTSNLGTTWGDNPKDCNINLEHHENSKFHINDELEIREKVFTSMSTEKSKW